MHASMTILGKTKHGPDFHLSIKKMCDLKPHQAVRLVFVATT